MQGHCREDCRVTMRVPEAGFSLIEVIIVVAVISVLAAVAVPVVDLVQSRARTEATLRELEAYQEALEGYFQDHLRFPESLAVLVDEGYITGGFYPDGATRDAWGTPYLYRRGTHEVMVYSLGPNKTADEPNLIMHVIGVRYLRESTRRDMQTISIALRNYERIRITDGLPDLPSTWWNSGSPASSALGRLIGEGLLPNIGRYASDAWGDGYRYTGSPADFVQSRNMGD